MRITFSASECVPEHEQFGGTEPSRFFVDISGRLIVDHYEDDEDDEDDEDEPEPEPELELELELEPDEPNAKVIGRLHASLLHHEAAVRQGVDLFDVGDCIDQDIHEMWCAAMDYRTEKPKKGLPNRNRNRNILYVSRLTIIAAYRGQDLGYWLMTRAIDLFGRSCGLVVVDTTPLLRLDRCEPENRVQAMWRQEMRWEAFDADAGQAKLDRYWKRYGFKSVPGSECYLYIDPTSWKPPEYAFTAENRLQVKL